MEAEGKIWLSRLSRRELLRYGLVAGVGLATADLLAACGGGSSGTSGTSITMKLGSDGALASTHTLSMVEWKRQIEAMTNGRIKCVIYPDAQLGGNDVMTNAIKQGALDGLFTDMSVVSTAVPECPIFNLPFLFKDGPQSMRAANGPIGAVLGPKIAAAFGCEVLGWGTDGQRNMWNSKHPIHTPADVRGLKMRVQQDPIQVDTYTALGALATPISYSEAYTSLQTKVVDGADIDPADMYADKFYEVTKYMTLTGHSISINCVIVSNKFMSKLSSQDQDIVRKAGKAGADANVTATFAAATTDVELIRGKGIEISQLTASDRQPFVAAVQGVYAKNAARLGGADFIAQAQNTP